MVRGQRRFGFGRCALVLLCLAVFWPGSPRAESFDHAGLARQVLEQHIRPGYATLLEATWAFETKATRFCRAAPGADMAPVRAAFADLVLAWSRIEHIQFGPVMADRRNARILYWPDRKSLGRKQIARAVSKRDPSVLALDTLAAKSVAVQGLGAAEYLLYRTGVEAFAAAGEVRDHRCGYLTTVAANLARIGEAIVSDWSADSAFAKTYSSPGPDNPSYLEASEVTLEIAKAFLVGLERLRDIRIAGPLGLGRKTARRTRAAFEPSGLSTRALAAYLEGLVALFAKGGLQARIEGHEAGMGKAILADLTQALTQLQSIATPMQQAAETPETENKLIAIGFPLKNARAETSRVLAEAAGLSLGFNALDGD